MKIKVNKSALKKVGKQLVSDADDLGSEAAKINSVINELAGYWVGEDRDKCVSVVKDVYLENLGKAKKRMESYGKYLQKVPDAYDEVDNTFMKRKI